MAVVIESSPLWQRLKPVFQGFDGGLALAVALLAMGGMLVMYSVGYDNGTRFVDHGRNMLIALGVMFLVAQEGAWLEHRACCAESSALNSSSACGL